MRRFGLRLQRAWRHACLVLRVRESNESSSEVAQDHAQMNAAAPSMLFSAVLVPLSVPWAHGSPQSRSYKPYRLLLEYYNVRMDQTSLCPASSFCKAGKLGTIKSLILRKAATRTHAGENLQEPDWRRVGRIPHRPDL